MNVNFPFLHYLPLKKNPANQPKKIVICFLTQQASGGVLGQNTSLLLSVQHSDGGSVLTLGDF